MIFPLHLALLSIGVLFLVAQSLFWNTALLALGILASLASLLTIFLDPSLFLLF